MQLQRVLLLQLLRLLLLLLLRHTGTAAVDCCQHVCGFLGLLQSVP